MSILIDWLPIRQKLNGSFRKHNHINVSVIYNYWGAVCHHQPLQKHYARFLCDTIKVSGCISAQEAEEHANFQFTVTKNS